VRRRLAALAAALALLTGCAREPRLLFEVALPTPTAVLWVTGDSLLAVESMGRGVTLVDAANGETAAQWLLPTLPPEPRHGLAASAGGETLAVATPDSIRVFLTRGLHPLATLPGGGRALALTGDGAWLASSDGANGAVIALPSGEVALTEPIASDRGLAWAPLVDGFAWTDDHRVVLMEHDGTPVGELGPIVEAQQPSQVVFTASGRSAAVATGGEYVSFWNVAERSLRFQLRLRGEEAFDRIALSANGWYLATTGEGAVGLRWVDGGGKVARWKAHRGAAVRDLAFSRDGSRLATVGVDGRLRVWAVPTSRRAKDGR
jgi:WD40 repeat protein